MVWGEIDKSSGYIEVRLFVTRCFVEDVEKFPISTKEWQYGAFNKPKFDNARKLTGIYYIDLEDM